MNLVRLDGGMSFDRLPSTTELTKKHGLFVDPQTDSVASIGAVAALRQGVFHSEQVRKSEARAAHDAGRMPEVQLQIHRDAAERQLGRLGLAEAAQD